VDKAIENIYIITLVLAVLLFKIISYLLDFQGGTREVSILPLSPLGNPPIPSKRLLMRRRAFATTLNYSSNFYLSAVVTKLWQVYGCVFVSVSAGMCEM